MRVRPILPATCALAILVFTAACASMRSVSVGSEEANYSIDVTNTMPHSMTVSWSDGGTPKPLGAVGSGRTERFIIAAPKSTTISVTARDANGTHNRTYEVALASGSPQTVTVR